MDAVELAATLFTGAEREQQAVANVPRDVDVEEVRREVRRRARAAGVAVRTAVLDGVVIVARLDADLWSDPVAEMRRKLTPKP